MAFGATAVHLISIERGQFADPVDIGVNAEIVDPAKLTRF
jgi:hypothetical protein